VLREIDGAHPALAEEALDAVTAGDHLAEACCPTLAQGIVKARPATGLARQLLDIFSKAMSTPKRILVPTDFGEGSEAALTYAIDLAKPLHAEVVVMHAYEIPVVGFPDGALVATPDLTTRILEGAREGLEKTVRMHEADGVALTQLVKQGDAAGAIASAANEVGAELVVMSTHGRRGLTHALLGSVAEKVVRIAPCPVLTVKPKIAA
jgi:nucleotide-binding universal stress UspA family protein